MKHSEKLYQFYFGRNEKYYLKAVRKFASGSKTHFNIAAFLLGPIWMLYRKMYLPFIVFIICYTLQANIEDYMMDLFNISLVAEYMIRTISVIVLNTLTGLYGSYVYLWQADRKITNILSKNLSETDTNRWITQSGGTSLLWLFVGLMLLVYYIILIL